MKYYLDKDVLTASQERVSFLFDNFEKIYVSFSGGKDSSVMTHLILQEAIKRNKKVWLLIIDLEAQYSETVRHMEEMVETYKDNIDLHWFCGQLLLRNAVSNYQPRRCCREEWKEDVRVRQKPKYASDLSQYDFYVPKMEFEEFMVLFGKRYWQGKLTAGCIWIRADESLHRYRAIVCQKKWLTYQGKKYTTNIAYNLYNFYPIYDRKTEDIRKFHGKYPHFIHNHVYDKMSMAWVKISQQRLCQPYWDDQRKWLWLYHILEPDTRYKLIARVNGVNSWALYVQERGNVMGYDKITKPDWHTRQSFCNMLLSTMPKPTMEHYRKRFIKFIAGRKQRGYTNIPDEWPAELESKCRMPSRRRMCKVLLKNDYWCKWLWQTQPLSDAYQKYKQIKWNRENKKKLDLLPTK